MQMPIIRNPMLYQVDEFYEAVEKHIKLLASGLKDNQEIIAYVPSAGIRVSDIGFEGSFTMVVDGVMDDMPARLVAHVGTVQLVLAIHEKVKPSESSIGFKMSAPD